MGRTSDAKDRLLETAGELFHDKGYNAVGISEICGQAGVNKGSFYYFFPSKQALALDVVDSVWHRSRDLLEQTLLADGPPLERLQRYFDMVYDYHAADLESQGHIAGCPLGNLAVEMSTQDSQLRQRLLQAFEGHIGYFERLLREARGAGELPADLDPRSAAESLLALTEGRILLAKTRNDAETLKDLGASALRLLGATST